MNSSLGSIQLTKGKAVVERSHRYVSTINNGHIMSHLLTRIEAS